MRQKNSRRAVHHVCAHSLKIDGVEYPRTEPLGEIIIPFKSLGAVRVSDIPCHSTVKISDLCEGLQTNEYSLHVSFGRDFCSEFAFNRYDSLILAFHVNYCVSEAKLRSSRDLIASRNSTIDSAFDELITTGLVKRNDYARPLAFQGADGTISGVSFYGRLRPSRDDRTLVEYVVPILDRFRRLMKALNSGVFLCHASEDKQFVDKLVEALLALPLTLWYDKKEIRVGDSIVEKVQSGLAQASHVVVVLSRSSTQKAWVRRELASTLMRQLANNRVRILPVLLEDCEVPTLLTDIKYADFRKDFDEGVKELVAALLSN